MNKPLRVLIIEDSEDDTMLLLRELQRGGYEPEFARIETPEAMKEALEEKQWDIIISDYVMPKLNGLAALAILRESLLDIPFIIVSGNIGEDIAVGAMRAGAHDYIVKGNLTRLVPAVERELREAEIRRQTELLRAEATQSAHLAALGELAAGVAHEINNPINGIINYAQMLIDKLNVESKEKDIADRIIKESNRIAVIVRSLLSFARVKKEEKISAHISAILSESLNLTEAQIRKDGIKLEVDISHNLPEIIAQPQQIQQVFLNVINNARYALNQKYPGLDDNKVLRILGKKITIGDKPYVQIIFQDNGIGIPADMLSKVMNPFFSTKPSGVGTGLGLSISHGIIADHNGKIAIESSEGEYTKVAIDLPTV